MSEIYFELEKYFEKLEFELSRLYCISTKTLADDCSKFLFYENHKALIPGEATMMSSYVCVITSTLVNVYVYLVVFTRIAGTLKTGSGRYWR